MSSAEPKIPVAIQGHIASFHEEAARRWFTQRGLEIEPVTCESFTQVCQKLVQGRADYALMAVENTIAGSLLPNYSLLQQYRMHIVGEVVLRIRLHLMALPEQELNDLTHVSSHPVALLQCQEFLGQNKHLQVHEATDTAGAALNIRKEMRWGEAAIASEHAAETYELEILARDIETMKQNYTRFLVLSRSKMAEAVTEKASISFQLGHERGSLAKVLTILSEHSLNLTKIQSIPVIGNPFQYSFLADMVWENRADYETAMSEIRPFVTELMLFGEYPKAIQPD